MSHEGTSEDVESRFVLHVDHAQSFYDIEISNARKRDVKTFLRRNVNKTRYSEHIDRVSRIVEVGVDR